MAQTPAEGVVELVNDLLRRALAARASDVHFEPGRTGLRVRFRVDALLTDVEDVPVAIAPNVVARLKVMAGLLTYRSDLPQEGSIANVPGLPPCDIRVATFPTIYGERVVLRLLGETVRARTLNELGHAPALVAQLEVLLTQPQGVLLVCGPAGSGKTTTLHALLQRILTQRPGVSIISLEDPVEIRLDGITQVEVQPERGLTYPVALRSLLRQDPQVLMIGEVRDAETARLVVEAALTGHLLLSTMHSGSPAEAIVRLREMGLPAYQITSTLHAVLAQRLLRTVCPGCGGRAGRTDCPRCLGSGYAGRTAIGHCVTLSAALRQAVLDGADVAALAQPALCPGSLHADAQRLVDAKLTTEDEVRRVLGT